MVFNIYNYHFIDVLLYKIAKSHNRQTHSVVTYVLFSRPSYFKLKIFIGLIPHPIDMTTLF